jgi:hypothetical protein
MHCPACHAENAADAVACTACGASLRSNSPGNANLPIGADIAPNLPMDNTASANREIGTPNPNQAVRRSGSRRRAPANEGEAAERNHRAARAFRLSLWSLVPGLGLFLGPVAFVLGCLVVRKVAGDDMARGQARVAIAFGVLVTLAQWIGLVLMIYGW